MASWFSREMTALLIRHSLHSLAYVVLLLALGCMVRSAIPSASAQSPSARTAEFVAGFNLNGPSIIIDGNTWQAGDDSAIECAGGAFENQSVTLIPPTDAARSQMLRSSRWGRKLFSLSIRNLKPVDHQVVIYVWEDNASTTYDLLLNGQTVLKRHSSGNAGHWQRLGPYSTTATAGMITLEAQGGDANVSGIELWSGEGKVPTPDLSGFATKPTPEQLAFFESKIRPLLINKCYECHNADAKEPGGGLLLDSRPGLVRGGDSGPLAVPGSVAESLLVRAVDRKSQDLQMPPDEALTHEEVEAIKQWVAMGLPDPRLENTLQSHASKFAVDWNKARDFWSLKPVQVPSIPDASPSPESQAIDRLLYVHQQKLGLAPAPIAERSVWLRRVTYDLTGLPPTLEEIEKFQNDLSPEAYERVIDRLLASHSYGQRWGRLWMDVVRYSDTAGDNSDFPIPQMAKYRDWVIDAWNTDIPFDDFVRKQIAGDLLPYTNEEEHWQNTIATGYIAGARRFGSRVADYPQHLTIEDTLDNLGRAFMATTLSCARCHDHKFDPVTTRDYYALYGIFASTRYPWPGIELEQRQRDLVPLVSEQELKAFNASQAARKKDLETQLRELEAELKKDGDNETLKSRVQTARQTLDAFNKEPFPATLPTAYAVADGEMIQSAAIQIKGDPSRLGDKVDRRFLEVLGGHELPQKETTSGRRHLAEWIVDRKNPLTARVIVNRIWLHHFGRGLVTTPNDFGRQGKPPAVPELLDYLASRLLESEWHLKTVHREILLSRTYRQSSLTSSRNLEIDPANEWLSSFPRKRLDAEAIRDSLLLLGGSLDRSIPGPHPFPPQKEWKFTQHNPFKAVYESNHRSVYLMTQRIQRHPFLAIFDGPDPAASSPIRLSSTTPLQALYFLNDPLVHEQCRALATRVVTDDSNASQQIDRLYLTFFARYPNSNERQLAQQYLEQVRAYLKAQGIEQKDVDKEAWQSLIRSLLRTNEFVILD